MPQAARSSSPPPQRRGVHAGTLGRIQAGRHDGPVPRCYPPEPEFGAGRAAERAVWEALRDQLPDEAVLFYSVGLLERDREFEADLVVGWPDTGIAVIEVKGGQVSCQRRQWYQTSGSRREPIGSPVTQAQDCRHVLSRLLANCDSPAAHARMVHLVAFPYTAVPAAWSAPDCNRSMVIDSADRGYAADVVRRALREHGGGHAPLDHAGLGSLVDILEGELAGQASLLSAAAENELRIDQLTRDQTRLLDILRYQRRLKVVGGAGTGKTWLALEQARRLARAGQRVALVCYTRGLARFFERTTACWPVSQRPAYVGLFHQLPVRWGAAGGAEDDSDYWERRLPLALGELAGAKPPAELFDSVVVDEAQDFGALWWPPTLACLRDPAAGGLFVFLDEAQRVFARRGEVPIPLPPYVLDENVRNTKRIAQVFGSLCEEQLRLRGLPGPPVRFHPCRTEQALDAADDEVDRLLDDWAPGQVALLTTHHRHPQQRMLVEGPGQAAYWDEFFAETDVFYGHVLGFKGLERPAVVLCINGFRDVARAKEMLYVGLSRPRTKLVVCGELALIAQVGGEGVRRRLAAAEHAG